MRKWIKWDGGKIPVPEDSMVQIVCRDEHLWPNEANDDEPCAARNFRWEHLGLGGDIIKYRVVKK